MTEGYRYNERNELTERIRAGSLTTYSYDKNGSIVSEAEERGKSEYRYDLLNRQIYVRTLDGREQDNTYDGEGLRAGLKENGKSMTFLFHNGEILTECDGDSAPARRHVRGIGLFHVQTVHDNVYHAYHQDEQGSTAYITGQENEVENVYQYDTFGNLTEKKEGITNRILYTGQQYDQETGQYYLRARYYNPVVGRFMQEDTYRGDGLNLYVYCANNPVVYYDPSGHDPECGDMGEKIPETPVGAQVGNENTGKTYMTGKAGEQVLADIYGGQPQVYFKTSQGSRFVDQLADGIAHESKVGYTSLTGRIKTQILKDAELIANGRIDGAKWHFFTSGVTGKGGASQPLLNFLKENGITYTIH